MAKQYTIHTLCNIQLELCTLHIKIFCLRDVCDTLTLEKERGLAGGLYVLQVLDDDCGETVVRRHNAVVHGHLITHLK